MGQNRWRNFLFFQAIAVQVCTTWSTASDHYFISDSRKNRRSGGMAVIIHNALNLKTVSIGGFESFEYLDAETNEPNKVLFLNIYRPPKSNANFFNQFNDLCSASCKNYDLLIIVGDFNIHTYNTRDTGKKALNDTLLKWQNGALSKPTISLMLPNGTMINSGHAEIPRGSSFVINCSVDSSTNFTMIHNNISIYKNPATFNISMADYKHAGNYYCLYNISTKTERINVIVTDSWWTVLFYILPAGILVLLLVVLLVVFLVCRSRRQVVKLNTEVFNQMTVRNSYADEEAEEEEEMDYVNVDSVSSKCLRANQVDEVDNDSHDYEEPDEISGAAEGNREEVNEEEDSSDDEHDYVNLTEQSADICREVDIYNNF